MTRLWPKGEAVETWGPQSHEGSPGGFYWKATPHRIVQICNRWRIHTRWWQPGETVWREYVKVTTDTGLLCLLYHDLQQGGWFLARIYD